MNTINIEGKEFTIEQLKTLIKNNEKASPMDEVYKFHNTTEEQFNEKHKNNPNYLKAHDKEVLIVAYYNKGEVSDWSNSNQYKYYGWFVMDKEGFRLSFVHDVRVNSFAPSALCFKNKKDALEAYEKFLPEIKESRLC